MRGVIFPPGDILFQKFDPDDPASANLWRETSFAFHLLKQAVNPKISISSCLVNWKQIAKDLAESPRKKNMQIQSLMLMV